MTAPELLLRVFSSCPKIIGLVRLGKYMVHSLKHASDFLPESDLCFLCYSLVR